MANQEIRDGIIWIIEAEGEWPLGPVSEPIQPVETLEDKIIQLQADNTQLKADNLILMDAIATMYEEILLLNTPV